VTEPTLVRRPVPEKEPEDTTGRRGCIAVGALLGVVAGAVFALFGLPPIIHHYFGTASIAVGETYRGDGKNIRVESVALREAGLAPAQGSAPAWFVTLTLNPTRPWETAYDNFELELEDGTRLTATPATGDVIAPLTFRAAETAGLPLRFDPPAGRAGIAKQLRMKSPSVRFDIGLFADGGTGATYAVGDKLIRVDTVRLYVAGRDGQTPMVALDLSVRSATAWTPKQDVFQLILTDGTHITAEPPTEKVPVTFAQFDAGKERKFELLFIRPSADVVPVALQLSSPAVNIALPAPTVAP
jgi:hypothetical protein